MYWLIARLTAVGAAMNDPWDGQPTIQPELI